MTDDVFLAKLAADPADDTCRLVYADWLDDAGHADRAAYLRAVVEMVRLCGDGLPPGPAAESLVRLAEPLPEDWRTAAGGMFSTTLFGCAAGRKINTIKLIRDVVGCGLAEAKGLCERTPARLTADVPFAPAYRVYQGMRREPSAVVRLLPASGGWSGIGVRYRILATYSDGYAEYDLESPSSPESEAEAEAAFGRFVAVATQAGPMWVDDRFYGRRALLEADVPPDDVGRRLEFYSNIARQVALPERFYFRICHQPDPDQPATE